MIAHNEPDIIKPHSIPIIALVTDFGLSDHYVGAMKGVILSICPNAQIIDLTHAIEPQNVQQAAFVLLNSYQYLPPGTIVVAVIDPGVGSSRKPIAVETNKGIFVGPDNGLFSYVFKQVEIRKTVALQNPKYLLNDVSSTFHGRDIFSPAGAHLASGIPVEDLGPVLNKLVWLDTPRFEVKADSIHGEIIYIDRFGNMVTSIGHLAWGEDDTLKITPVFDPTFDEGVTFPDAIRPESCHIQIGEIELDSLCFSYSNTSKGNILAVVNSARHLEIAINQGNAAEKLGIKVGEPVILRFS